MNDPPPERELLDQLTERELRDEEIAKLSGTPQSGDRPDQAKDAEHPNNALFAIAVVAFCCSCLFGGCWVCVSAWNDASELAKAAAKNVGDIEATIIAKRFVKAGLDFPEEAEFPGMFSSSGQASASSIGNNAWGVQGEVVGKNAFGVKIRHRYVCELKFAGGDWVETSNWELLELVFYEP